MARKGKRNPTCRFKSHLDNLAIYVQSRQNPHRVEAVTSPRPSVQQTREGFTFESPRTTNEDEDDAALDEDGILNDELEDLEYLHLSGLVVEPAGERFCCPPPADHHEEDDDYDHHDNTTTSSSPPRPAEPQEEEVVHDNLHHESSSDEKTPYFDATYLGLSEIHQLALESGVSLEFVDKIFRIMRKHLKDGFDIMNAPLRNTFMKNARLMLGALSPPLPTCVKVEAHGGALVPKFSLLDQICDLMQSVEFQDMENLVVMDPSNPLSLFEKYIPNDEQVLLEVHSGHWYDSTYENMVQNPEHDWLFPLIFYIDKTGTDAMQRYPLEPLMVTTSVLKREVREKSSAWRHIGFVPPCDDPEATPEDLMQYFHRCLEVLLADLVGLQQCPPTVEVNICGLKVQKRLLLPVAFVMGDQLSQDKHCGRKAINSGGAGKIHRRCMCSSLSACSTTKVCVPASKADIEKLVDLANQKKEDLEALVDSLLPLPPTTADRGEMKRAIDDRKKNSCTSGDGQNLHYNP
jgi:hypothetical protein